MALIHITHTNSNSYPELPFERPEPYMRWLASAFLANSIYIAVTGIQTSYLWTASPPLPQIWQPKKHEKRISSMHHMWLHSTQSTYRVGQKVSLLIVAITLIPTNLHNFPHI